MLASPVPADRLPSQWLRAWSLLGLVLAATLWLYRDTAWAMVEIWSRADTFTHCFLVPPIVLWLVWRRRHDLHAMAPQPNPAALVAMLLLGFAWLLGDLAAVNALTQLTLVAMLVLSVPALLGLPVARAILFPLAFSFFAVPTGEFLMPQFMEWTADFTVWALRLTGIPVYREGLQFVIPSGRWSVVEACSGIRYLIASVTVGTLYAYLNYQSMRRRALFVLVSLLVPIVANWLRAYMIVMVGHLSGNTLAVGVDHLIYGWVFFGVVILLMFFIGARWAEAEPAGSPAGSVTSVAGSATPAARQVAVALALILAVSLAPAGRWWLLKDEPTAPSRWSLPPPSGGGWTRLEADTPPLTPIFDNALRQSSAVYERDGRKVGLYVAYYRQQSYESKLVSSTHTIVRSNSTEWTATGGGARSVVIGDSTLRWRVTRLRAVPIDSQDPSAGLVAWQVYWVNGLWTSSDHLAKAHGALSRILGRGDDSAVVIVYSAQARDLNAEEALQGFLSQRLAAIEASLREAQASR